MFENIDIKGALKDSVIITGSLMISLGTLMFLSGFYPPLETFRLNPSQIVISATAVFNLVFAFIMAEQI